MAIAYYAIGLLGFPLKAIEHVWHRLDATVAQGILAPVLALGVWIGLSAWRHRLEKDH